MEQFSATKQQERSSAASAQTANADLDSDLVIELVGLPEQVIVVKETCVQLGFDEETGEYQLRRSHAVAPV